MVEPLLGPELGSIADWQARRKNKEPVLSRLFAWKREKTTLRK